ncbi:vomeronasal type-1 receptor 3-like [Ochotona princeps]|uniref:vomeronasal type-1 receptor 3-like n=1 Tax=Ochotona princeps TaxID=9978 RepID=UPI0027149827|nr:vomeronasal type-1 receptor 3-like [Ochotona princeps]
MSPSDTIYGFFLLGQVVTGIVANSLLFLVYVYIFLRQPHLKKSVDSIFMHLTIVNTLGIIFQTLPEVMSFFRIKKFLDDIGCQTFMYLYRITRGLSICTTSLLSVFQAITISPSHSKWAWLKSQLSKWILPSLLSFWVINMVINVHIIRSIRAKSNDSFVGKGYVHVYCESGKFKGHLPGLFISVIVIHDVLFMLPMIGSSLYVVFILYRHRRRARHIRSLTHSSESSAENKASRTILLLVSCFVFFYVANNSLTFYGIYKYEKNYLMECVARILSACYPTFCPFLLMKNNKIIPKLTSSLSNMRMIFSPRAHCG